MKTKAEFQAAIAAAISNYPTAAQFYQAQDPRLLAQLDAMATMLSMVSAEMDVAAMEPFTKARDMTVLADAAIKGVLPFGKPAKVKVAVVNGLSQPLVINAGRRLLDTQGREYVVDLGATIAGLTSGFVTAIQRRERVFTHTVTTSRPFYSIPIPAPDGGRHIAAVEVKDADGNVFDYQADFVNVGIGDHAFHIESDESRTLQVQFGAADIAGYQPSAGEEFTVTVIETDGAVEIGANSPFAFEYSYSLYESGATLKHDSMLTPGAPPLDASTLREICSYPSIYDSSAVYLGNFDFLIRRSLSPLRFLSIWNEQVEEEARGASVDNINKLFVAAKADGVEQAELEDSIARIIKAADDSYRIAFIPVDDSEIAVEVIASVGEIYDSAAVEQQVRDIIAAEYGPDSVFAKRGRGRVRYKRIYEILKTVQAFQASESDLEVTIDDPVEDMLPEQYRYVSNDSLTVTIQQAGA